MADVTFDGDNLLVLLPSAQSEVVVKSQMYGAWKRWAKTGTNARFLPAFDTTGGDPTTTTGVSSPFYYLRNDLGWRIRPAEQDAEVTIIGNLYGRNPLLPIRVPTTGGYTVLVSIERDASSIVETISQGSGLSAEQANQLAELHRVAGLETGTPVTISTTQRQAGGINQSIAKVDSIITVTRQ